MAACSPPTRSYAPLNIPNGPIFERKAWNPQMKKTLLEMQEKKGTEDGSWAPSDGYGMCACVGRTMSTALGAMTLEVYYRYLRIYE